MSIIKPSIDYFHRTDREDSSTIYCSCGESFEWEGFDNELQPFIDKHIKHVTREEGNADTK